jgi:hypothetical protein
LFRGAPTGALAAPPRDDHSGYQTCHEAPDFNLGSQHSANSQSIHSRRSAAKPGVLARGMA